MLRRRRTQANQPAAERPVSDVYPVLDTDLARDNIENDLTHADLCDLDEVYD